MLTRLKYGCLQKFDEFTVNEFIAVFKNGNTRNLQKFKTENPSTK